MADPWPTEIRLRAGGRALAVAFDDAAAGEIRAELLRCQSPSAEVQGHSPAERRLVPGKRDVAILSVDPVGNYAVRLGFDDGHETGIYTWTYLASLAGDPEASLASYREELAAAGLTHEPPPRR